MQRTRHTHSLWKACIIEWEYDGCIYSFIHQEKDSKHSQLHHTHLVLPIADFQEIKPENPNKIRLEKYKLKDYSPALKLI